MDVRVVTQLEFEVKRHEAIAAVVQDDAARDDHLLVAEAIKRCIDILRQEGKAVQLKEY